MSSPPDIAEDGPSAEEILERQIAADLFLANLQRQSRRNVLTPQQRAEWRRCADGLHGLLHFINTYCFIYTANSLEEAEAVEEAAARGEALAGSRETTGDWVRFRLWQGQHTTLEAFFLYKLVACLKARQLGMTWLALAFALWLMLFKPIATVLLFSKRDTESIYLLGDERLRGMYKHLPSWMQNHVGEARVGGHVWTLTNGSTAKAFPTTGGDSYTATLAVVDEAALIKNLATLMASVKPTIDAGGRMILVSRANKDEPEHLFHRIYVGARNRLNSWKSVFLGWFERPERTQAWYDEIAADYLRNEGSHDTLWEQYPATDTEALAPRTLDKRLAPLWLEQCYEEQEYLDDAALVRAMAPAIPGLRVYRLPKQGGSYIVGGDPAEGNPTSNDSAIQVMDVDSGEQCCVLAGKYKPRVMAGYMFTIGVFYNRASLNVLRNNHGHAVINELRHLNLEHGLYALRVLVGKDGKAGFPETPATKTYAYDSVAEDFRVGPSRALLHDFRTRTQLGSIDGQTLKAPEGMMDDEADAWMACHVGRLLLRVQGAGDGDDDSDAYGASTFG